MISHQLDRTLICFLPSSSLILAATSNFCVSCERSLPSFCKVHLLRWVNGTKSGWNKDGWCKIAQFSCPCVNVTRKALLGPKAYTHAHAHTHTYTHILYYCKCSYQRENWQVAQNTTLACDRFVKDSRWMFLFLNPSFVAVRLCQRKRFLHNVSQWVTYRCALIIWLE